MGNKRNKTKKKVGWRKYTGKRMIEIIKRRQLQNTEGDKGIISLNTRSPAYSWMEKSECSASMESVEVKPFLNHSWYLPPQDPMKLEPDHDDSSNSQSHAPDTDENLAYFQFFKSIFTDYKELVPKKQRLFRRQCLNYLHELLDESEQSSSPRVHQQAINLSSSAECSREQSDHGMCVVMKVESCENEST